MSVQRMRREVALACAFLAGFTGAVIWLLTGRPMVGITALAGALAAGTLALLLAPRQPEPSAAERPADGPDRASLVRTCIYLRDRVTSTALASRLDQTLTEVGVTALEPAGERFDPGHHEAGGTVSTTDDALAGTIAAVETPGYADRGVLLRAPVVTVYRLPRTPEEAT